MPGKWTRREFVQGAAGVVALPGWRPQTSGARFAYVASANDVIHAFRVRGEHWTTMQQIASTAPAALAIGGAILYVANDVGRYDRLPRGSVECFRIGEDGRLTAIQRVALSLSATHPRSLALSPDGKLLAVASYQDAIYNLFAVGESGPLSTPSGIFKDTGCARPHSLRFDATGTRLISCDEESGRVHVFTVDGGRLLKARGGSVPSAIEENLRITGDSIYYNTVKVANVPAAITVALKT